MRRVTRNGVFAVVAASGAMAFAMPAHADSAAAGSADGSPGVISGNTIQLPLHVPVNVCGNTVNVVGLLNPAMGNACSNKGASGTGSGAGTSSGGAVAQGGETGSPGVISGNGVQLPVDVPVNACGNTANVVGIGNPVFGNHCENNSGGHPVTPTPPPPTQPVAPPTQPVAPPTQPVAPPTQPVAPPTRGHSTPPTRPHVPPQAPPQAPPQGQPPRVPLAHTGAELIVPTAAGSAVLLLTGTALVRRFRPRSER